MKKYKSSRDTGTDTFNRETRIGDVITYNNGGYRGSTTFKLGIIIGFTNKKTRIVTDIYTYGTQDKTKLVDDSHLVLMAPIDPMHPVLSKVIELADPFLLGDKINML